MVTLMYSHVTNWSFMSIDYWVVLTTIYRSSELFWHMYKQVKTHLLRKSLNKVVSFTYALSSWNPKTLSWQGVFFYEIGHREFNFKTFFMVCYGEERTNSTTLLVRRSKWSLYMSQHIHCQFYCACAYDSAVQWNSQMLTGSAHFLLSSIRSRHPITPALLLFNSHSISWCWYIDADVMTHHCSLQTFQLQFFVFPGNKTAVVSS